MEKSDALAKKMLVQRFWHDVDKELPDLNRHVVNEDWFDFVAKNRRDLIRWKQGYPFKYWAYVDDLRPVPSHLLPGDSSPVQLSHVSYLLDRINQHVEAFGGSSFLLIGVPSPQDANHFIVTESACGGNNKLEVIFTSFFEELNSGSQRIVMRALDRCFRRYISPVRNFYSMYIHLEELFRVFAHKKNNNQPKETPVLCPELSKEPEDSPVEDDDIPF